MVKTGIAVLVADLILFAFVFLVAEDSQMRIDCTLPDCQPIPRASAGFGYAFLSKTFSFVSGGNTLTSPPILDWVQVLVFVLVALNAWFVYRTFASRRRAGGMPASVGPSNPQTAAR